MRGREAGGDDIAGFTEALPTMGPEWGAAGPKPGREKGGKARLGECLRLVEREMEGAALLVVKSKFNITNPLTNI